MSVFKLAMRSGRTACVEYPPAGKWPADRYGLDAPGSPGVASLFASNNVNVALKRFSSNSLQTHSIGVCRTKNGVIHSLRRERHEVGLLVDSGLTALQDSWTAPEYSSWPETTVL